MLVYRMAVKVCLYSLILALLLSCVLGCAKDDKEASNPANTSIISDKADVKLEALKSEGEKIKKQIDEAKKTKTNDNVLTSEDREQKLKILEEQEAKLLEQSKEMEEKIKKLQKTCK